MAKEGAFQHGQFVIKGGAEAIKNAEELLDYYRLKGKSAPITIKQIKDQMRLAVDRVMSEGSLYDAELAAIALKQAEGDTIEASFLVRVYRSTQPRMGYTIPSSTREMFVIRRISSAFKNIPGGQVLGPTRDFSQRLIRFELADETMGDVKKVLARFHIDVDPSDKVDSFPKMLDIFREEGLLPPEEKSDGLVEEPFDITREAVSFPAPRSARLQALTRGETGAILALGYSDAHGYGYVHPILSELRVGYIPVKIQHPSSKKIVTIGEVLVTEAELLTKAFFSDYAEGEKPKLQLGYGLCFGHNEIKALNMASLDRAMSRRPHRPSVITEDQEAVMTLIDGLDSQGLTRHWNLPHYVTWQNDLDRLVRARAYKKGVGKDDD